MRDFGFEPYKTVLLAIPYNVSSEYNPIFGDSG